jgi:photosystem II stability/assembly factor-like uncharacterized protein
MKGFETPFGRRVMLAGSLEMGLLLVPALAKAAPPSGVDALDRAAIKIARPTAVFLVAITRAGNRLVASGEHGVIIYSDDNGASWVQASVPVDVTITCMQFVSPQTGWAAGAFGVVLNTTDAGATWQLQLQGLQVNQLTLAAAQAATAANSNVPGAPFAMRRANFFEQSGPSKPFLSFLALSPQQVIVFGAYRMTVMTTDAGKTWVDWSLHVYDRLSNNLYAALRLDQTIYVAGEAGLVFTSTDGGNSFLPVATPATATLFGLLAAADGSITVFGVAGTCLRTTDGGKNWAQITLPTANNLTSGRVLQSKAVLIASEDGSLFMSKDNGATYKSLTGLPNVAIFDFEQAANGDLILVSDTGISSVPSAILNS